MVESSLISATYVAAVSAAQKNETSENTFIISFSVWAELLAFPCDQMYGTSKRFTVWIVCLSVF